MNNELILSEMKWIEGFGINLEYDAEGRIQIIFCDSIYGHCCYDTDSNASTFIGPQNTFPIS